jgi:glycosyltransferase involved in cell wall biosynthesis
VKILVVSSRCPLPDGKGDQVRSFRFIAQLAGDHDVTVVTSGAGCRDAAGERELRSLARVVLVRPSALGRAVSAMGALAAGVPAQVGWMTPRGMWRATLRAARDADVVLAMTARSLRGSLPAPLVLDHVDALSLNMRRRAGRGSLPARLAAISESLLMRRWERRLSRSVTASLVTSPEDAAALPAHPVPTVLPVSIPHDLAHAGGHRDDAPRPIDLVLTGNMAYPSNADAAAWLSAEIAPRIWARRPDATIAVVGRNANRLHLDARIAVHADVADVGAFLRRATVAAVPLRLGTGSPYKVLEALASGAVVLGTPAAVRPFGLGPDVVATGTDAATLADGALALLGDPARCTALRRAGRAVVDRFSPARQHAVLVALLGAVALNPTTPKEDRCSSTSPTS